MWSSGLKKNYGYSSAAAVLCAELERTTLSGALGALAHSRSVQTGQNMNKCLFFFFLKTEQPACRAANCSLFNFNLCRAECGNTRSYLLHTGSHMGPVQTAIKIASEMCCGVAAICDALITKLATDHQPAY